MPISLGRAFAKNFLGNAPRWYKIAIVIFLLINPIVFHIDPFLAGWLLVVEFIFTLAMALKCYPLQPGGLLAIEAVLIGMTSANQIKHELVANIEVLLLLVFMVAGIYFMKQLLLYVFTKMLVRIHSKTLLSLAFCLVSAFLSAFLDALTVIAVVISVATGFYAIYHKVSSGKDFGNSHDYTNDNSVNELNRQHLDDFRAFLRSLMMHAAIGTALGGVCTLVGEPQNLIIGEQAGWHFGEFAIRMAPVTLPVFLCGLLTVKGGTNKIVEYFGPGTESISATGNCSRIRLARRSPPSACNAARRRSSMSSKPISARRRFSSSKRAPIHCAACLSTAASGVGSASRCAFRPAIASSPGWSGAWPFQASAMPSGVRRVKPVPMSNSSRLSSAAQVLIFSNQGSQ